MIFYFSATGNGKHVAETLAAEFGQILYSIPECIDNGRYEFDAEEHERVGIVSPTYFLGLPSIVTDFLRKLVLRNAGYVYFIATYGTTPGRIDAFVRRTIRDTNINAFFSLKMPDTWTPVFDLSDTEKVKKKALEAEPYLRSILESIRRKSDGDFMRDKVPLFFADLYYKIYGPRSRTKNFTVDEACIGCGLCEKKCPSHAIRLVNERPTWIRETCTLCLGCLHRCPEFSIQYGRNTKNHGHYTYPNSRVR